MSKDEKRPRRPGPPRPTRGAQINRPTARPRREPASRADESDPSPPRPRQRIAKLMARAGLCSRRAAESWILEGRISVNGSILTTPAVDVGPDDLILVDGAPLPEPERTRLFLFHKLRGLVTSDHDPEGRPTVADFLRTHWPDGPRIVTVGRLDINTEGLLLLTNDGGLARVLELPQTGWIRRYRVRVKGETDQARLDTLAQGVTLDGIDYAGIEARLDRIQGANCWLTMGLREGKNREIKRVLEHLGLEVNRLIRISFGPFQLLDLAEGAVEEVRQRVLRDQLGESLAAAAGVDFGAPPAHTIETRSPAPPLPSGREPERNRSRDRGNGAERTDRAERRFGARPATREGMRSRGRTDPSKNEPPAPRLERPQAGTRKHVSALRRAATDADPARPRQRIERSETADRRSRIVHVERVMDARGTQKTELRKASPRARGDGERPARRGTRSAHTSPSALGKRERIARSGAAPRSDAPRTARTRDDRTRDDRRREGKHADDERGGTERPRDRDRHRSGSGDHGSREAGTKAAARTLRPGSARERDASARNPRRLEGKRSRAEGDGHAARSPSPRKTQAPRGAAAPRNSPKRGANLKPNGRKGHGPRGPAKPKR